MANSDNIGTNNHVDLAIDVRLGDEALAAQIDQWLRDHGARDVQRREEHGFFPLLPIIIGGFVASGGLASLVMYIRGKTRCQVLIDARGDKIHKEIDCRIKDGRLIVLTKDGQKVEVIDAPEILDMTAIVNAALTAGADALKTAAEGAGATVKVGPAPPSG